MSEIKIDLVRPVTNRQGVKQAYITLREPTLGDMIECGRLYSVIMGREAFEEIPNYRALETYLVRLSRDVSPEVLKTEGHPADADRIMKALSPFLSGPVETPNVSSGSSSSATA